MATKKDLVEAYAFSRRRLVTAFVSGAPGGREVEPARPGRTIVGGLALAVLLVAGAAIAGVFAPTVPDGWADQPGLVISQETGAAYVITDDAAQQADDGTGPVLRPVINITSAMLILGSGVEPQIVPQEAIDAETIGDDIGILNAPASVPSRSLLIESGWTACTSAGHGIRTSVAEQPGATPAPDGALVVHHEDDYYVVARARAEGSAAPGAYRYQLPDDEDVRDALLSALGLPTTVDATAVPQEWLGLFPTGGALDWSSFDLEGEGDPVSYADAGSGLPADVVVGDVVRTPGESLLLTAQGPAPLDDFAAAVYSTLAPPHRPGGPVEVDGLVSAERDQVPFVDAHWPDTLPAPVLGEACALLSTDAGRAPVVQVAADPTDDASSVDVPEGQKLSRVDAGRGAYVLSGDFAAAGDGAPFLVDAKGNAYPLAGAGAADLLGYGDYPAPLVPDSWVELFTPGVTLSPDAALCPPDPDATGACA